MNNFNGKVIHAVKWSSISEIIAKLIVPITNMILARILSPEAFGVIATVTLVISFAEMFSDSGFQKYLIQYNFLTKKKLYESMNVSFWTNLLISLLLWTIIGFFNQEIASLAGSPGLGNVILVAGISLPLTSFSSIQIALYRRNLDFKTLFYIRIIGVCIPLVITVPLAFLGFSYWSLIIGTIVGNFTNAIFLTIKSTWKPRLYYDFCLLKKMLNFSIWSLTESLFSWITSYAGTLIVGGILNEYYLGLYKTTIITVNGIMAVVTVSTTSVLFSSLSRLQDNDDEFKKVYLIFLKSIAFIILPMGIGIFLYKELITEILLGSQWKEAIPFVGIYGLMSSITLVFSQYSGELYKAKGKPKISVLAQLLYLMFFIPTLIVSSKQGFSSLIYATSFIKIQQVIINNIILYFLFDITPLNVIKNVKIPIFSTFIMGGFAIILQHLYSGFLWSLLSIFFCIFVYFGVVFLTPSGKKDLAIILQYIKIPKIRHLLKN